MPDFRPLLDRFPALPDAPGAPPVAAADLAVVPMSGGLINATYALGQAHVLQKLHRIFRAEVNADIAALVPRLLAAGVTVPRLVPARDGAPSVTWTDPSLPELEGVWRVLTRLPGDTVHKVADPRQARSAGRLVARFHGALVDVAHDFAFTRPGAHDTDRHLATLAQALDRHPGHRLRDQVGPLAEELHRRWQAWGRPPTLPTRIVHGDLKISNLLFDAAGEATAVLDLDTMAHAGLDIELGDALRSWCNTGAEDDAEPRFDARVFTAAMAGYLEAAGPWLQPAEVTALVPAVERICLELAARFAADALDESYFGWDPTRFATRGDHDLVRARNQLGLAGDVARQRGQLEADLAGL